MWACIHVGLHSCGLAFVWACVGLHSCGLAFVWACIRVGLHSCGQVGPLSNITTEFERTSGPMG